MAWVTVLLYLTGAPLHAYVCRQLWSWYIAPEFDLHTPNLLFFYGLTAIVAMFKTYQYGAKKDEEEVALIKALIANFAPLIVLGSDGLPMRYLAGGRL